MDAGRECTFSKAIPAGAKNWPGLSLDEDLKYKIGECKLLIQRAGSRFSEPSVGRDPVIINSAVFFLRGWQKNSYSAACLLSGCIRLGTVIYSYRPLY